MSHLVIVVAHFAVLAAFSAADFQSAIFANTLSVQRTTLLSGTGYLNYGIAPSGSTRFRETASGWTFCR